MQVNEILGKIRTFLKQQSEMGNKLVNYTGITNVDEIFKKFKIKVDLDNCKEIILREETRLELGGTNKESFSLVYPISEENLVEDRKITLIGPEIEEINDTSIDFGMFILLKVRKISQKIFDDLLHFNFLSNGIEGFLIRTIPRRFWCRISQKNIAKKFSFEFLGNAIMALYKQKFKDTIESVEIIFINSYQESIKKFIVITDEIRKSYRENWKEKIEKWKKNIDCDYDWDCADCPYEETCDEVKDILEEREKIG